MKKTEQKSKRGGARKNSGRKPASDPKEQIAIYVHKSTIKRLGKEIIRTVSYNAINEELNKY